MIGPDYRVAHLPEPVVERGSQRRKNHKHDSADRRVPVGKHEERTGKLNSETQKQTRHSRKPLHFDAVHIHVPKLDVLGRHPDKIDGDDDLSDGVRD